jgi:hypothetical protein
MPTTSSSVTSGSVEGKTRSKALVSADRQHSGLQARI